MHKHSNKPASFTGHAVLPTVKAIPISTRQQWSAKKRLGDSIDIEPCWMDGWLAFNVTVDGWFNCRLLLKKEQETAYVCVLCVLFFPCVHLCMCKRENSERWQLLSQAYRQTLSPVPTLNHLSLWHAQKCHELALSLHCMCVWVWMHLHVCAPHQTSLYGTASSSCMQFEHRLMFSC